MSEQQNSEYQVAIHRKGRNLYIFGNIFHITAFEVTRHIHDMERESRKPITIYINSDGGNIVDGIAIHDVLRNSKCEITTIGLGCIESIATIVFLGGTIRKCHKNCRFMYHQGTIQDEKEQPLANAYLNVKDLMALDNICDKIVVKKTNWTKKFIYNNIYKGNFYFSAKDAVKYGWVHEILNQEK